MAFILNFGRLFFFGHWWWIVYVIIMMDRKKSVGPHLVVLTLRPSFTSQLVFSVVQYAYSMNIYIYTYNAEFIHIPNRYTALHTHTLYIYNYIIIYIYRYYWSARPLNPCAELKKMLQALQVGNLDILWDTWKVTQRSWGIWIVYDIYI